MGHGCLGGMLALPYICPASEGDAPPLGVKVLGALMPLEVAVFQML